MSKTILQTSIPGAKAHRGKVRDIYDAGNKLIIAATDRISAFDVVMKNGIPGKGTVLTQISKFWFEFFEDEIESHFITDDVSEYPEPFNEHPDQLEGRSMLVRKTKVLPIECIIRGYITGSGWKDYKKSGKVCGHRLPEGLKECQKLPEPLYTPSTKAEYGEHDENISVEKSAEIIGKEAAEYVSRKSIEIFEKAGRYAADKGIILADTKFEWGRYQDDIILIDEVLTPDSSRFWPGDDYEPGRPQKSFDKQFVRDYLEKIDFDKSGDGIELPEEIVSKTSEKYIECFERLTGKTFSF
ncbi:Phosphoribosylaminoimidazole-succinocarboxamide synthase [Sedimentisphaera cyanobacteriorum]|uniref:Phosphoribosylaminoimidazole-succinocarboxamide synthase n=1 Tax=Sedimentisphaera cyanobacteriorum TaxID=1940790 RepID=A0A1Q2HQS2_9BACT|nr:phosphoribosylaminoimidazolesuccinocarboxamide synthase [Sedimentisphaera cyanobacteriorum]AQQ09798.1 Phosphoribosylaminoimidazole-succinocarboxamide synthase [Sedimentisphaera cyanobacteriorum]